MVYPRVHQVALDYLLRSDGTVDLAIFTQGPEHRPFTDDDRALFASREKTVKTSSGDYGLFLFYSSNSEFGETKHLLYKEGYVGEVLEPSRFDRKTGSGLESKGTRGNLTSSDD